jgi:hypothetical protein
MLSPNHAGSFSDAIEVVAYAKMANIVNVERRRSGRRTHV